MKNSSGGAELERSSAIPGAATASKSTFRSRGRRSALVRVRSSCGDVATFCINPAKSGLFRPGTPDPIANYVGRDQQPGANLQSRASQPAHWIVFAESIVLAVKPVGSAVKVGDQPVPDRGRFAARSFGFVVNQFRLGDDVNVPAQLFQAVAKYGVAPIVHVFRQAARPEVGFAPDQSAGTRHPIHQEGLALFERALIKVVANDGRFTEQTSEDGASSKDSVNPVGEAAS